MTFLSNLPYRSTTPRRSRSHSLPLILLLATFFISSALVHGDDAVPSQEKLNGGYYLLHHLCGQEAKLPLLLMVKQAPEEIRDFADKISRTAKESNALLDKIRDSDPAISFDQNPLPPIEQDVRDSLQEEKQHQLLFGTSGDAFVQALLVSQIEASNYGMNLGKVLSDQESDPDRKASLTKISNRWLAIHTEAIRLLSALH